jgi:pterin-4a-carbinolamine dehydratase
MSMYDADDVKDGPPGEGAMARPFRRLKAERVQDEVRALPGWEVAGDGAAIRRVFPVEGTARAYFLAYAATYMDEPGRELALVTLPEGLECRLSTPAAGGVTEQDLELAKELSRLG